MALVVDGQRAPLVAHRPVVDQRHERAGHLLRPPVPVKTETALAMWSASSPWPQASWNSTPPLPHLITTGIVPDGRRPAPSA